MITLDLNARFQPLHRGDLEDALEVVLAHEKLGVIGGGGALMAENGEIERCDIDIETDSENIEKVAEVVNALGVPKGSFLISGDKKISIGTLEGLALYLNGTDLDDEVYANCDVNFVIQETEKEMRHGIGSMKSYAELDEFTVLYYYGESFDAMKNSMAKFVEEYPLCKNCKIVQIA